MLIYGINAVTEAIRARARSIDYIGCARERHDARLQRVIDAARTAGVQVRFMPRDQLDRLAENAQHQGVVASLAAKGYVDVEDIVAGKRAERSFIVVLDGIEDPHNLGAVLRTADAAGVDGVIIPERRAVGLTGTVAKAAAGASETVPLARVTNISRTLEELKRKNIWTVGLDERGTQSYDAADYNTDIAIVLGAEGHGLHDLVRKRCDFLVSIPMAGQVSSLNVSVAAAVVMFEVVRQRRK
jgi:23S rRNA (guanosine2251-2'-O)-methyltransferase